MPVNLFLSRFLGYPSITFDKFDQIDDDFVGSLGAIEGLHVIRIISNGMDDEQEDAQHEFVYDPDAGEIILPVGEVDPWLYVHTHLQDRDI